MYWILALVIPCVLSASSAFNIDSQAYQDLDEIALNCTDKSSAFHDYTQIYSYYFSKIRDERLKFLEIGVYQGGSVSLWEKYFKNAELHFIDNSFRELIYNSKRAHYHLADQREALSLIQVMKDAGGEFDIMIDDGGHHMDQQIISFITLFPYLKSGGLYFIEDLHTSYWWWCGGSGSPQNPSAGLGTMIEFLKSLIDDVNFVGARTMKASHNQDLNHIKDELDYCKEHILGLHFYDSLCVVIKR